MSVSGKYEFNALGYYNTADKSKNLDIKSVKFGRTNEGYLLKI